MTERKLAHPPAIKQETPERAPNGWAPVQESIAESSGIALLLVEGHQPPALAIANNNSICEAIQSSAEHSTLCDPFCGDAHRRALSAGETTAYRCHLGLNCLALPVHIGRREDLAVIAGRSF